MKMKTQEMTKKRDMMQQIKVQTQEIIIRDKKRNSFTESLLVNQLLIRQHDI